MSSSYSAVPYILGESPHTQHPLPLTPHLVDPLKESGQALYRQYVNRKGKLVLDARWIYECVKNGQLQTFKANWAGCKLDGTEKYVPCLVLPALLKFLQNWRDISSCYR